MTNMMYMNDKHGAIVVVASHPDLIIKTAEKYSNETPVAMEGPLLDCQVALEYALSMYAVTKHTRWVVAVAIAMQEIEEIETGVDPNSLNAQIDSFAGETQLNPDEPEQD